MTKRGLLLAAALLAAPAMADEVVPMPSCRVLDTRNTTVGIVAAGTRLDFGVRGTPGLAQGGQTGCGVPARATGVLLNVVAISPSATGHVLLWPYGTTQPITSALNVTAAATANDGLFGLLAPSTYPPTTPDLSLKGSGFAAYYVVDLMGYIEPSVSTLRGQAIGVAVGDILVIRTKNGADIKVYAPSDTIFRNSWNQSVPGLVMQCVHINGFWVDIPTLGGSGFFEAVALPMAQEGYCGPDEDEDFAGIFPFKSPRVRLVAGYANAPYAPNALEPGDAFIIANGIGAFAGHDNDFVIWNGADYYFDEARNGDLAFFNADGKYYRYYAVIPEWRALALVP